MLEKENKRGFINFNYLFFKRRQTEQIRVDRAVQAGHSAGQKAAVGEVAERGEARGERGAGRSDQDNRLDAGVVGLPTRSCAPEGGAVLRGDWPVRQDHPLRQEGQLHA